MKTKLHLLTLSISLLTLLGCSGSSSDSATLIQGTLTEAGGAQHRSASILRHTAGEHIGAVEICALGECSTTNEEGQWGFVVDTQGVESALFTIKGHGIDTTTVVALHSGANEIFIDFQHVAPGVVDAHKVLVDGQEHSHS